MSAPRTPSARSVVMRSTARSRSAGSRLFAIAPHSPRSLARATSARAALATEPPRRPSPTILRRPITRPCPPPSTFLSALMRRRFSSGVPMVTRSAVSMPKLDMGRTITPSLRSRWKTSLPLRAHVDEDEVGAGRHVLDAHGRELLAEEMPSRLVHAQAFENVRVVLERGERRDLGERVHVEGRPDAVEEGDAVGIGHRVAHAQAGEAGRLGEGAQDGDLSPLLHVLERVGEVRPLGKLEVGLVEHHDDLVGHARHEGGRPLPPSRRWPWDCSGWR